MSSRAKTAAKVANKAWSSLIPKIAFGKVNALTVRAAVVVGTVLVLYALWIVYLTYSKGKKGSKAKAPVAAKASTPAKRGKSPAAKKASPAPALSPKSKSPSPSKACIFSLKSLYFESFFLSIILLFIRFR